MVAWRTSLFLFFLLAGSPAGGQKPATRKPEKKKQQKKKKKDKPEYCTVVVGDVRPKMLMDSSRSVSVLGNSRIRKTAGRTTPEIVAEMPGVMVQKTNHGGGSAFIRGFTGQHVLYLVDGIRLNNSTTRYGPNQSLNTIDPFTVRRLELLRGPGSMLYGSDALGEYLNMAWVSYWSTATSRFFPQYFSRIFINTADVHAPPGALQTLLTITRVNGPKYSDPPGHIPL